MRRRALALAALLAVAASGAFGPVEPGASAPRSAALEFGDAFWRHWGDGRAELAAYDLVFPRYGAPRTGVAIAIFVTETFSNTSRVKADPGKHAKSDEFPVMKLNLVRDFATGIYDYNLMTSAFVALERVNGRPAGSPTKVSLSSQEWCGNVYAQILFDSRDAARYTLHSYFDGEGDQNQRLRVPEDAVSEDALLLWARGFAAPALAPGESRVVALARSLLSSRLRHVPQTTERAKLTRETRRERVTVPAGTFETDVYRAELPEGRGWTIWVERAEPRRVIRWETREGESARLIATPERLEYWKMNGPEFDRAVERLGLDPRRPRMP